VGRSRRSHRKYTRGVKKWSNSTMLKEFNKASDNFYGKQWISNADKLFLDSISQQVETEMKKAKG